MVTSISTFRTATSFFASRDVYVICAPMSGTPVPSTTKSTGSSETKSALVLPVCLPAKIACDKTSLSSLKTTSVMPRSAYTTLTRSKSESITIEREIPSLRPN